MPSCVPNQPSWKTQDERAEGRPGREQVEQDRLDRDHDRMEDEQQQQEGEAEDEQHDPAHAVRVDLGLVEADRRASPDVGGDAGQTAEDRRDDRAHGPDARSPSWRDRSPLPAMTTETEVTVPSLEAVRLGRAGQARHREQRRLEPRDGRLRGRGSACVTTTSRVRSVPARPVRLERLDGLHAVDAVSGNDVMSLSPRRSWVTGDASARSTPAAASAATIGGA